jgi:hypothetical protein
VGPLPEVDPALRAVHDAALPHYTRLRAQALHVET